MALALKLKLKAKSQPAKDALAFKMQEEHPMRFARPSVIRWFAIDEMEGFPILNLRRVPLCERLF